MSANEIDAARQLMSKATIEVVDIIAVTRALALEEAAGIAESFGMVFKQNLEPYWEGWDDSTDRVSQAIRAVAGAS